MSVKVLILEDNPVARGFLRRVVRESFSDANLISEAGDLETARRHISLTGGPHGLHGVDPFKLILVDLELPDGQTLHLEPLKRSGRRVMLEGFDPCAILLNNDLSAGTPAQLVDLSEQVLLPPLHAGWSVRRKTLHFAAYNDVAKRFAKQLDIDPWLVNPYFAACTKIDFQAREGEECLATGVETLLRQIRAKYREYKIDETPFVIVKADAGTYGMGVMSVKDPSEVRNLNRKQPTSS